MTRFIMGFAFGFFTYAVYIHDNFFIFSAATILVACWLYEALTGSRHV